MIYLIVAFLTVLSILVMIILFDHQLLVGLYDKAGSLFGRGLKYIGKPKLKPFEGHKRLLPLLSGSTAKISVIPALSILAISATTALCYFLITHNSLAVYHNSQETSSSNVNSQINQLLVGERLSPPPAPPEELFAELEAEIATYQANQVEEGYWPSAPAGIPQEDRPLMLPEPDLSDLNVQDHSSGYSGDMLASHLSNGHINIKNADRNWKKMNSEFVQRLLTVYKVMSDQYGYDMVLLEGYRSPERQARLLSKGSHVTNAGSYKSYHQFGLAGDSAFIRNGKIVITEKDPWAMQGYKLYGKVAKSAGLVWGGDWRMMDLGHVELRKKGVLGRPDMAEILTRQ